MSSMSSILAWVKDNLVLVSSCVVAFILGALIF